MEFRCKYFERIQEKDTMNKGMNVERKNEISDIDCATLVQVVAGFKGELITTAKYSLIALFVDLVPD